MTFEQDRLRRVKEVFSQALDADTGSREALLDLSCAGDAELREQVDELLVIHAEPEHILERLPASLHRAGQVLAGTWITGRPTSG